MIGSGKERRREQPDRTGANGLYTNRGPVAGELFGIRVRPTCTLQKQLMKSLVVGLMAAVLILITGCATHSKPVAREYRVIQGVTDASGAGTLEDKLNSAAREGYTIHSTTLLPREENQRPQAVVILERPAR